MGEFPFDKLTLQNRYYILDLSDEVGRLYSDLDMYYKIDRLIDLKVVEG